MSNLGRAARRGARWFRLRLGSASIEDEIRDELEAHIALAADYLEARGRTRDEAEREARARFGAFDTSMRRLVIRANRQERRVQFNRVFDELRQDMRLSLRSMRRSPVFVGGVLVTLALGVGANATVFTVLRAALLQPLPYAHPGQLHMLWLQFPKAVDARQRERRDDRRGILGSGTLMEGHRTHAWSMGDIAAALTWQGNLEAQLDLAAHDRVLRLNGAFVTPNFFDLLGARAERGRLFGSHDDMAESPLIVLSHGLWRREFGGDPSIIGKPVLLTGGRPRTPRSYVVAGVLPPEFHFTYPVETEVWVLRSWSEVQAYDPRASAFLGIVRLDTGIPLIEARRRTAMLRTGLEYAAGMPAQQRPFFGLESMSDWVRGEVRPSLELLGAVAALLLIVACVTVGAALLVRLSERRGELGVRAALGAGRTRLVRQLLAEGAVLSIGGSALGVACAAILQPVLRRLLPASIPRVGNVAPSGWLIVFAICAALATIILATLLPAWSGSKIDTARLLLRGDRRSSSDRATKRWQQGLIGAQAAIATLLLTSATVLLVSFWRLGRVPLGFDGSEVVTVEMRLLGPRFREEARVARFQNELMTRLRGISSIAQAGLTSAVPFRGVDFTMRIGRGTGRGDSSYTAQGRYVDSDYFGVLRIPLLRGRLFTAADDEKSRRVVILSESLAKGMFGAENPIGRVLEFDGLQEVVGVVGDVRYVRRDADAKPALYFSRAQSPNWVVCVVARTRPGAKPADVARAITGAIRETDPTVPAMRPATIDEIIDETVSNRRYYTVTTAAFASIAFVLTAVGLFVIVARVVAERRRELAIRAALGATMRDLARHASRDTMMGVTAGVLAGLAGAFGCAPLLDQFLFEASARSLPVYAFIAGLLLATAFVGSRLPMRVFGRVSLAEVLKAE